MRDGELNALPHIVRIEFDCPQTHAENRKTFQLGPSGGAIAPIQAASDRLLCECNR